MANQMERQISEQGPRNMRVRLTGILDTSDVNFVPAISLDDSVGNDERSTLVGYRLDHACWSISAGLTIWLQWTSLAPQTMVTMSQEGEHEFCDGGISPDQTRSGYTGGISVTSSGFAVGDIATYTIDLHLVKRYA